MSKAIDLLKEQEIKAEKKWSEYNMKLIITKDKKERKELDKYCEYWFNRSEIINELIRKIEKNEVME